MIELEPVQGPLEEYRTFNKAEIITELQKSGYKLVKTIPILQSVAQDLFHFKVKSDNTLKELKVTEDDEKLEILYAHVHEDIKIKVKGNANYDEYFKKIFKLKYKKSFSEKYESLLEKTKQVNFTTIKEYKTRLDAMMQRMQITDKLTEKKTKKIKKKWFFKNLHEETKIKIASEKRNQCRKQ